MRQIKAPRYPKTPSVKWVGKAQQWCRTEFVETQLGGGSKQTKVKQVITWHQERPE